MTRRRTGMTLVELLVVTGLMATLLGLVLTGLRSDPNADPLQAAREFASVVLAAQSRALGKPEGAAVIVEAGIDGRIGATVHEARSQPLILTGVTGIPPMNSGTTAAPATFQADVAGGYKVRFQAPAGGGAIEVSPWFRLQPPATTGGSGTVSYRSGAGQTPDNTIWPKGDSGLQAVLAREPVPGGSPVTLAKQVAIDLRHSGVGDEPTALHRFGRLEGNGPVAIVFDEVGRIADVMQGVGNTSATPVDPLVPTQPIYFLFAVRDDITTGRNTLASDKAIWVAIHPLSGRVSVAANVPQSAETATALRAARENVRRGMTVK